MGLLATSVMGQATERGGLLPEDSIQLKKIPFVDFQMNSRSIGSLPTQYSLIDSLIKSPFAPSCSSVGQAIATAYTIHYAKKTADCTGRSEWVQFSAGFIDNQIKQDTNCNSGARIGDGLALVQQTGICPETHFPTARTSCVELPNIHHLQQSSNYKISSFRKLTNKLLGKSAPNEIIDKIKEALYTGHPVIIGMQGPLDSNRLPVPTTIQQSGGCEAMVLTAYDKNNFEIIYSKYRSLDGDSLLKMEQQEVIQHLLCAYIMEPLPCTE